MTLAVTGLLHIVLFVTKYSAVAITGPAFLAQGVVSLALAGLLYASDRDVLAPLAAVALMTSSVVAVSAAYLGVFINTSEGGMVRFDSALSFGAGVVALAASALVVKQRADLRQGTDLPTPGVDEQRARSDAHDDLHRETALVR